LLEIGKYSGAFITILALITVIAGIVKNPFKLGKSFIDEISSLSKRLNSRDRYELLCFEQDLRNNEQKSDYQFDHILEVGRNYLAAKGNGPGESAYNYIRNCYDNRNNRSRRKEDR